MDTLAGKVVVVTGASSGIGRAVALGFAGAGARVALAARRADDLVALAAECRAAGGDALPVPTDVADRAAVDALAARTLDRWGRIDVLVAAAGINVRRRAVAESDPAEWQRVIDVNVLGVYHAVHATLQPLLTTGGLMILIGSMAAKRSGSALGGSAYTASKHALVGLASSLAAEQLGTGLRVTVIHPGLVNTPILDQRAAPPSPEARAQAIQPADIAQTCLFLARLPARCTVPELSIVATANIH